MRHGIWFAYCSAARIMPLDALARRVTPDPEITPRLDQPNLLILGVHDALTGNDAAVTVSIERGGTVTVEATEVAEDLTAGRIVVDNGLPPPDPAALVRADARYELTWELRFSDETYNAMMIVAGILIQECGAMVYDATNRRFV